MICSLFSQLCVNPAYDARSLAAAAVNYAITNSSLRDAQEYNPNWLEKLNTSRSSAGRKQVTKEMIQAIQSERKQISLKIESFKSHSSNTHKRSMSNREEEQRKRTRVSSPVVESVGREQPSVRTPSPLPFQLPPQVQSDEPPPLIQPVPTHETQNPFVDGNGPTPLFPPEPVALETGRSGEVPLFIF